MNQTNQIPITNRIVGSGLGRYLTLARKWLWLLVLVTSLGALAGYLFAQTIAPTYRATTTMLIGQLQQNLDPTQSDLQASTNLAAAYALLTQQPEILEATAKATGYGGQWQDLYYAVQTTAQPQLLRINVSTGEAQTSQALANELANQLIVQGPISERQSEALAERQFIQDQLVNLRKQILAGQETVQDLTAQLTIENDPDTLRDTTERVNGLQAKVDAWQNNYAALSDLLSRSNDLYVTVLAPATLPTAPISPNIPQIIIIGAILGFILSCVLIYTLEYIDDTIKDAEDSQRIFGKPTLGAIIRISGIRNPADGLVTLKQPRSPIAEAYRVLRTNLRFSGIENPGGVMLVTSAGPGEGKSTTAANLAVSLAQVGKRVVLVDADLRRPSVHKLFGMDNSHGLSDLLSRSNDLYVTVLAPATLPTAPISPNIPQIIIIGAILGFILSCVLIYTLEYIDDTIKDAEDSQRIFGKPTLGAIIRINGIRNPADGLVTLKQPRSPIAEAYRVLRTNLRFSGIENPGGVMLVTSAGPGEGKSTTAANLAVSLAQVGKRVVLVDADLRRPSVHKLFGMDNSHGLSDLFSTENVALESVMQNTSIPSLRVITSGAIPPNPAEMLDSRLMTQILATLRQNTDMVIIDSPPVLPVADASILGSRCSGAVLVVDSGKTRTEIARRAVRTLEQANVKVAGVILNKMGSKQAAGYYYYYYGQKNS